MNHSRLLGYLKATILMTLVPCFVFATGKGSDGGGKGVVCRDNKDKIISVELLDLWEAKNLYNYRIEHPKDSVENILKSAIHKLKDAYVDNNYYGSMDSKGNTITGSALQENQMFELASMFFEKNHGGVSRKKGITLVLTNDSYEIMLPSDNCRIEQIITFLDSSPINNAYGQAIVNEDLVIKMDAVNQAALYAHEVFYKLLRARYNESSSIRTRRAIGWVFSNREFTALDKLVKPTFLNCSSSIYKNKYARTTIRISEHNRYAGNYSFYVESALGVRTMGFAEQQAPGSSDIFDNLMKNDFSIPSTTYPYILFDLQGYGPIEYDQHYGKLMLDFSKGKIKIYFLPNVSDYPVTPDLNEAQELQCELKQIL